MATETTLNLPEDLRQALDQAVEAIVEIAHPQLIILFGSWAEGNAREDSDVDLLVVAETDDEADLYLQTYRALRQTLGRRPVDLLAYSRKRWDAERRLIGFVAREAERRGQMLYASS